MKQLKYLEQTKYYWTVIVAGLIVSYSGILFFLVIGELAWLIVSCTGFIANLILFQGSFQRGGDNHGKTK